MPTEQDQSGKPEKERAIPLDLASDLLKFQLSVFPEIQNEFIRLSNGIPGVSIALVDKIANEISFNPLVEMSPEVMRILAGAPIDDTELPGWRQELYVKYRESHQDE